MIRERDTSAYVLALLSGWAVVSVETERGARLILALRGAGEVVGDLAAVDQGPAAPPSPHWAASTPSPSPATASDASSPPDRTPPR